MEHPRFLDQEAPSEAEPQPQFDAVLVHGYWISRKPDNAFRSSLRSWLATRAAALAYDGGKLVLTAGRVKGASYPSTAALMRKELVERCTIPSKDIVIIPKAYGTAEEVDIFLALAKEQGWKNVADIGFKTHYRSISRFLPQGEHDGLQVSHLSVEDIIDTKDTEHGKNLLNRLRHSRYEVGFKGYELVKDIVMRFPGGKEKLYTTSKEARTHQQGTFFNDANAHLVDVFIS